MLGYADVVLWWHCDVDVVMLVPVCGGAGVWSLHISSSLLGVGLQVIGGWSADYCVNFPPPPLSLFL